METIPQESVRTLVVDDSPEDIEWMKRLLKKLGQSCDEARDGEEGLQMYKNGEYDLVLTDVKMPGMSGIELCERIREHEKETGKEGVYVVGFSGHDEEGRLDVCFSAGMNQFFQKPTNAERLESLLRKVVEGKELVSAGA